MGSRGISNDHTIVLYGDRNNWFAAYTYWYFLYYGHDKVKLMNGPREKWIEEGRETTDAEPDHAVGELRREAGRRRDPRQARRGPRGARRRDEAGRRAQPPGVLGRADRDGRIRAGGRPARRAHPGRGVDPLGAGGAGGRDLQVGRRAARAIHREGVLGGGDPVIAYCRIGERSAHSWFVLHELLGEDAVRNYDGSWTEWGNLVDVPIEKGA